jgi:hypothetical protein
MLGFSWDDPSVSFCLIAVFRFVEIFGIICHMFYGLHSTVECYTNIGYRFFHEAEWCRLRELYLKSLRISYGSQPSERSKLKLFKKQIMGSQLAHESYPGKHCLLPKKYPIVGSWNRNSLTGMRVQLSWYRCL